MNQIVKTIKELEVNDGSRIYYLFQLACKLK